MECVTQLLAAGKAASAVRAAAEAPFAVGETAILLTSALRIAGVCNGEGEWVSAK